MENSSAIYRMVDHSSREEWLASRGRGIGASEACAMCGASKYESQADLWELKVGLRPPKAETEAMRRGHDLEASVRDRFMQKYGYFFDMEYHEFGMCYRTDYPHLYATLDGVLKAKYSGTVDIEGITLKFTQGERCIYEVKNPAPRDWNSYYNWDYMPEEYKYQASQQMLCSGIKKHLLHANITGECQSKQPYDERFFFHTDELLAKYQKEIFVTYPRFWACIEKKERPATAVEMDDATGLVVFDSKITAGSIWDNLDKAKASVIAYTEKFKGLTFSDGQYKEAKSVRAELNRHAKTINDMKVGVKKQWMEPYTLFESRCKELISIIDSVAQPIDEQIKDFETRQKAQKLTLVKEKIERIIRTDYPETESVLSQSGGLWIDPRWVNASTSMAVVEKEAREALDVVRVHLITLDSIKASVPSDVWLTTWSAYLSSGRNIQRAVEAKTTALTAKAEAERKTTPPPAIEKPQPQETAPQTEEAVYTKVVEFKHTDLNEFKDLIAYLKAHGFRCREIKNPTAN